MADYWISNQKQIIQITTDISCTYHDSDDSCCFIYFKTLTLTSLKKRTMMHIVAISSKIKMQLLWLFLFCNIACAQKRIHYQKEVDQKAVFPFGEDSLRSFINKNIRWVDNRVAGKGSVLVCFVVNKQGEIQSPSVCKSNFWEAFEKEAIRLVELMPKWIPAKKRGKMVNSEVELLIRFELE